MNISELIGKTLTEINVIDDYEIYFRTVKETYKMFHQQSCCESVSIDDICGDLNDLINSPILQAEETSSYDFEPINNFASFQKAIDAENDLFYEKDSQTWTFYKISTIKGSVTIRWYGSSNEYYSESVDFVKISKKFVKIPKKN